MTDSADKTPSVDPRELLRKIMQISPEDAEDVRRDSPATPARTRRKNDDAARVVREAQNESERTKDDPMPDGAVGVRRGQHGPTADYGDDR